MNKKHDEKWLLSKGWTKTAGWALDNEMALDDEGTTYFDSLSDFARECTFYQDPNNDEFASDDLDACIERQEEYEEDE